MRNSLPGERSAQPRTEGAERVAGHDVRVAVKEERLDALVSLGQLLHNLRQHVPLLFLSLLLLLVIRTT